MAGTSAGKMRLGIALSLSVGIAASGLAAEVDAFLAGTAKSCIACDLSGRDLKARDFRRVKLDRVILKDADLSEATLFRSTLQRADLSGAKLVDADLNRIDAKWADFRGADWEDPRDRVFRRELDRLLAALG